MLAPGSTSVPDRSTGSFGWPGLCDWDMLPSRSSGAGPRRPRRVGLFRSILASIAQSLQERGLIKARHAEKLLYSPKFFGRGEEISSKWSPRMITSLSFFDDSTPRGNNSWNHYRF